MITELGTEILARDSNGDEHQLKVGEYPSALISLGDDGVTRILAQDAALELARQLLRAVSRQRNREVGLLDSTFGTGRA
jgi:ATP phosphoribosyltransferase regulatory subunit HisZ